MTFQAIEGLQTLVFNQSESRSRKLTKNFSFEKKRSQALPAVDSSFVLRAVIEFIGYSRGLHSIIFESAKFTREFVELLSTALGRTKSSKS